MTPVSKSARFIEPGLMSYEDTSQGVVLVSREALDRMAPSFKGCPVIFVPEHHNDADKETAFNFDDVGANPPSGIIAGTPRWGDDGWQYVDMLIWDENAVAAIDSGYSVSCAYNPTDVKPGGIWHQLPYDEELVNGQYMHMAIVPRPRYEGSQILANSKGGHTVAIKLFGKNKNAVPAKPAAPAPANAAPVPEHKEPDGDEGMMVNDDTEVDVNGTPVPLHELIAKYVEAKGGEPAALMDEDMVALPDGTKVSVADLKAAWGGASAEGEGLENAEPPADTPAPQPVEVSRQKANAAPAKPAPRVVNPTLKNAAAKPGEIGDPRGDVDTEAARLARGKERYSRPVANGGK